MRASTEHGTHNRPRRAGAVVAALVLSLLGAGPAHAASTGADDEASATASATDAPLTGGDHDGDDGPDRDLAVAEGARIDPDLLAAQPGDSDATAEARRTLARVDRRLRHALAEYRTAAHRAAAAASRADALGRRLAAARAGADAADAAYHEQRDRLASLVTQRYRDDTFGAMGVLMTAGSRHDLLEGVTAMEQGSVAQSEALSGAATARADLQVAVAAAAALDGPARTAAAHAATRLDTARTLEHEALASLDDARTALESSVLADEAASLQAARESASTAAYDGRVSFPLPAGTTFVDQHNWGGSGTRWARGHTGDDLSTACGTPVLAATGGTVVIRTDQSWAGSWLVMVSTGSGKLTTWYAHMQALHVTDGEHVEAGQRIGDVGTLGNSTGCHLHFELHPTGGGIYDDNVDPGPWWQAVGVHP